ncbi:MAG: glycerol kinase GlpK [Polyangiaceae bacterium]
MARDLLLAIDQGTTGTTALVMDREGATLARHTVEFQQHFPEPGWVEHDAEEIWRSVERSVRAVLDRSGAGDRIAGIGITNQRETTLVWDRGTSQPIHRAIVWQDRRTAGVCAELRAEGKLELTREKTGLVLDPYFSGTKIQWLLDHVDGARARADRGELAFGTIDSFLIHRLSGGAAHVTDATNASRTLLMNLGALEWDDEMLGLLRVPRSMLPTIVASAGVVAETRGLGFLRDGVPIAGIAGDQQAALFGQACFAVGDAKCTYGTGAFALANVGRTPRPSAKGLLSTVAWKLGNEASYALEGSAFIAGAAVQWLRDGLGFFSSAAEIEALASQVGSSDGVVFVPALSGLGTPHWDPHARGLITGLTRGTTRAHIARATLEGIAHQVADLTESIASDLGKPVSKMRVDGGAAANDLLMQIQADLTGISIERPRELESTARGAAMLAGVGTGLFASALEASVMARPERIFTPSEGPRREMRAAWALAVRRAMTHADL